MKNYILVTFFAVFIISVNAQPGLEAGALVQPQIYGQLYDTELNDRSLKIPYSFAIGFDLGYNFTDKFGFRTGAIYTPEGEKYNITSTDPEEAYELNLSYIQVPFYLKFNSSTENRFSFIFIAGPSISFLNDATLTQDSEDPVPVLGDYRRFNTGGAIGLGLQMNIERGGNVNLLWRSGVSLNPVQEEGSILSRSVSTGLQVSYHYFIYSPSGY
ncbi:outer membrane beta-barrel protein [Portibacter lacus]|uniref:Outer membrane protein beta-barrel domain-containing protein n=1 Tax=Portibacter lacus TaxID=1099794 RepID=A0AA37WEI1_9BACT|nr:outer membrane beta-barrel protein [Portibacter lacus]GLR18821.1 hypothetical protein GCM10007940_34370 [Portibacter lacus]